MKFSTKVVPIAAVAVFALAAVPVIVRAYSISDTSSTAAGSTMNIGQSLGQLTTPFNNFLQSIESIQPGDVNVSTDFSTLTSQIPTGLSPSTRSFIIDAIDFIRWIVTWLKAASNWIAAWIVGALQQMGVK